MRCPASLWPDAVTFRGEAKRQGDRNVTVTALRTALGSAASRCDAMTLAVGAERLKSSSRRIDVDGPGPRRSILWRWRTPVSSETHLAGQPHLASPGSPRVRLDATKVERYTALPEL